MGTNWTAVEFVANHIEAAAAYLADAHRDHVSRWLSNSTLESPLEAAWYVWWSAMSRAGDIDDSTVTWRAQQDVIACGRKYRLDVVLMPQLPLKARAEAVNIPVAKIAVELDGHDFHERTREQVAYRNQRDRDLQSDGWQVLHFSGSEMHRDPAKCVAEAFDAAYRAFGMRFEQDVIDAEAARGAGD
jgi:hypothetical protein